MNYTIGSIKCFTTNSDQESNADVIKDAIKHGYIILLNKCLEKALSFGKNVSKRSQMLV